MAFALTTVGMQAVAPNAAIASPTVPPEIQALLDGLGSWGDFTQSLATQGALGQALPLVSLTPGSSDGLGFGPSSGDHGLIGDSVYQTLNQHVQSLSGSVSLTDLGSATGTQYPVDLGDGRTGTLTVTSATNGSTDQLIIGLEMTRTVTNQALDITGSVGSQPVTLTSTGGVNVQLHTSVSFDASVQQTGSGYYFYIGHDGNGPSIEVDARATIPTPSAVDASIGILGVSLSAASFSSDENLAVSFDDPNGDGQLAFTNADGSTGELSQAGATTGLVHVTYGSAAHPLPGSVTDTEADQGTSTPATFTVSPKPLQTGSTALPDVQLGVSWPDVSTGSPAITNPDNNLQYANDFLNLSTKDLADGIAHLATTVDAIQRSQWGDKSAPSGNFDLPFMKGTAADAVDASAALSGFVTEFTHGPANPDPALRSSDPAKVGVPTFASIQELVSDLDSFAPGQTPTYPLAGGATITVGTISFNDTTSGANKLLIPLTIQTSPPASPIQLDVQPVLASGAGSGVTYTPTSMTDANLGAAGFNKDLAGQQVEVTTGSGTETAIINSVNGDTLDLKQQTQITSGSQYWVIPPAAPGAQPTGGSTPSPGDAYRIVGPDPQTGTLQLGDALGHGVKRANADASKATVQPSYTLNVGLVLDLQPAVTGTACDTTAIAGEFPQYGELPTACPFQHTNPDGSTTTIGALPVNTDRIQLRTSSISGLGDFLTEDFPVASPAPADFAAQVGYLAIHLSGQLNLDAPTGGHMRTIQLKPQAAGDLALDQIVRAVTTSSTATSSSLLTETAGGTLGGHFAVDVPGSSTSPTPSYFGESDTCSADNSVPLPCFSIAWADISTGSASVSADNPLGELDHFDFDSTTPTALLTPLIKSLQVLDNGLSGLSGAPTKLADKVPVVGKALGSLVAAQDSGGGPNVTYGSDTLTDSARPFDSGNDPGLATHTMTVGTQMMTIQSVTSDGQSGTVFTFTQPFPTKPADGTAYTLTSPLKDAIAPLASQPPANLQDFLQQLTGTLGYGSTATINLDTSTTPASLVVNLDWKRTSHTESTLTLPVQTSCTTGPCPQDDLTAAPTASPIVTTTTGEDKLGVEVPLAIGTGPADPTKLDVTGSSQLSGGLAITGADTGAPDANIGPLPVKLGGTSHLQISGAYHVEVGTGSGNATDLSSLLSQQPTIGSDGTSCPSAGVSDAALCAFIPVYNPAKSNQDDGPVTVNIPKSASDLLDLTGNVTATNKNLGDDIQAAEISFGGLLGGIDNYFTLAEQGLNKASFDGKLPFIGNDLQQGSDFVGQLKDQFDTAVASFTSSVPSTAGGIKGALQTDINNALSGDTGVSVDVKISCAAPLQPVTLDQIHPVTDNNTQQTYTYDVLAYKNVSGNEVATIPGGPQSATNDSTLNGSNYNPLSWSKNADADGYLVLVSTDGTNFHLLKDITTNATVTYKDDGSLTPASATYAVPTSKPSITYDSNCPDDTSIQYITGVSAEVKAGGSVSTTVPFDIGIPGLSLSSTGAGSQLTAKAGWKLDLTFGIDKDSGFYIKADNSKVLSVSAEIVSPSSFTGQLAVFKVDFTDNSTTNKCGADNNLGSLACVEAALTLNNPSTKKITASDLANPSELGGYISAAVSGNVNINWHFVAQVDSALPGASGDFVLKWNPSLSTSSGLKAGDLDVEFDNVTIDAGSFLSGIFGQILTEVKKVTDPLQPVVDTLTAPIPVLSQLSKLAGGGDVTLLSIAQAFNTLAGGPDLTLINRLVSLLQLFNKLGQLTCSGGNCGIDIGSYVISGTSGSGGGNQQLLDNTANPESGLDPSSIGDLPAPTDLGSTLSTKAGSAGTDLFPTSQVSSGTGDNKAISLNDNCAPSSSSGTSQTEKAGLTFPVIEHPLNIFRLLLGQDIALACFDSGVLSIGFSYSQAFGPVYAPPPVLITISGSASASLHIVGGFDTYGIRTAIQDGKPLEFLDSLFFTTTGQDGKPIPVVSLKGTLAAGAEVSIVLISVGVQGGITLTVNFTWRDPDNDGKFRFDEFLTTALQNPLCLFNVSGSLSVFLELDITLGISPFSTSFSITLVNIKLLDFSIQPDCTPPPPQLAGYDPGSKTLIVFMGALGTGDLRGDSAWNNGGNTDEKFKITQFDKPNGTGGYDVTGYAVDAMGVHDYFPTSGDVPQPIDRVYIDAQNYNGAETVLMQGALDPAAAPSTSDAQSQAGQPQKPQQFPFTAAAVVYGGNKDDNITTGSGPSFIDGGGGGDQITTDDVSNAGGRAVVAGGAGNDVIRVGNADDQVAGDASLDAPGPVSLDATTLQGPGSSKTSSKGTSSIPDWTKDPGFPSQTTLETTQSTDGNDTISLGLGADTAWGGGGDDSITVAPDNPAAGLTSKGATIIGGDGSDHITGGNAGDSIYTGRQETKTGPDDQGSSDACSATGPCRGGSPINVVDTGGGVDTTTNPPTVIGSGNDTVYGSQGIDLVAGHSSAGQTDTFYGGGGDDVLTGGYGTDRIFGGPGNDYVIAEPSQVSDPPGPDQMLNGNDYGPSRTVTHQTLPTGVTSSTKLLVGGGGNDHIFGGDGGADIFGDSNTEAACPTTIPPPSDANNTAASSTANQAGDGNDYIVGGSGQDVIQAGGGNDYANSGSGDDFVCGGAGNDRLITSSLTGQTATVYGGDGNDVEYSGHGADYLFGNSNDDTLYAGTGNDTLEGNSGTDALVGGSGNDLLVGGTTAAATSDVRDVIYGGTGNQVIIGDNGAQVNGGGADLSAPGVIASDQIQVYDLTSPTDSAYGGKDTIFGGTGNDQIFGGLAGDFIWGGTGTDHIEGGPGSDTIWGGSATDDILGGTSPLAVAGGSVDAIPDGSTGGGTDACHLDGSETDVSTVPAGQSPVIGNCIYGDHPGSPANVASPQDDSNVIVGGNGSITPVNETDPNNGQPLRAVQQLALLSIGGNDHIYGGPADDQIFGGLGDDTITTGNGDNYVEGGPGDNTIFGGTGSNDIIGGTSPLALPTAGADALTTADVPSGADTIFADGLQSLPPTGYAEDKGDVVLGDNGCIDREIGNDSVPRDANGCPTGPPTAPSLWTYSQADPTYVDSHSEGLVERTIHQLDVFDCPNSACATPDVQGTGDTIYGGTGDDVLLGEVGNDHIYGGPPDTNGLDGAAGTFAGNDYMEGGGGSDTMAGGAGDDDMIGGTAPTYLPPNTTTAMVGDGTPGSPGFTLPPPANPALVVPGSGELGNTMDGGGGNDVMVGGNGRIDHVTDGLQWARNQNDGAFIRTVVQRDLANGGPTAIGGDDTMRGGPGYDRMFGGARNDYMDGGAGDDYLEGGAGRDILQGGAGDDDLVGGTSPIALLAPDNTDAAAGAFPDGTPDPGHAGRTLGNIICGYYCGQSLAVAAGSDDDAIVANNGRIDRCPASVANDVGTPGGSDSCMWSRTSYGTEKATSYTNGSTGGAQSGQLCTAAGNGCQAVYDDTNPGNPFSLGDPRTRYITLLGQDPAETTHNGDDYIEGNGGNDVIYGEDGSDAVHGDTPAPGSPRLDECLPTNDPAAGQDIIVGGYGNDTLCGDGGDDAILGNRGLVGSFDPSTGVVAPVPFPTDGSTTTVGTTSGGPFGVFTFPASGNTIYPVRLDVEYVDGVLTPVPNWNDPTTATGTGQANQHDVIFGGQGNDTIHGSPGDDFIQGDDGMHITGAPPSTGGDDIVFGDGGNDSVEGGPGNDHIYGGNGNDDQDVIRSDTQDEIAPKVDESGNCYSIAFPTLNIDPSSVGTANGYCPNPTWANMSYAKRFPTVDNSAYDSDPGALDNGGRTKNTKVFGDILYGGYNRDISQSQGTPPGYGDRIIDSLGAYNLEFVCPAAYGGSQIIRALSPNMLTFLQQLSTADGAYNVNQTKKPPASPLGSGDSEASIVYPSANVSDNGGSAYPTTAGHFNC